MNFKLKGYCMILLAISIYGTTNIISPAFFDNKIISYLIAICPLVACAILITLDNDLYNLNKIDKEWQGKIEQEYYDFRKGIPK